MVDTHPGDTNRLHEYWVHGKGAAQIKWGTPGDFDRCTRLLEEHAKFTPEQAHGYCNLAHHAATGMYPAKHAALIKGKKGRSMADQGEDMVAGRAAASSVCVRAFDWEMRSGTGGDGRTLEGYAAVFNAPATIRDAIGEFEEVILPGAFKRSLERRKPVLQFEHGRDPRVGATPIGTISDIGEDDSGLHVRARLFANDAVEPVREAIAEGAISGMSFRFSIPQGGDVWQSRKGGMDLREIREADTSECGPVVFPAYDQTSVSVRSLLAQLDPAEYGVLIRELAAEIRTLPTDLAGRPAVVAGGGDSDGSPGNGGPSPSARVRDRALRMRGILK